MKPKSDKPIITPKIVTRGCVYGHPFLQDEAGQVIDLRNDHHPIRQKPDG